MIARLFDSVEAAGRLGVSEHQVRQAYRSGLLPHRKVGRFVRFTEDDLTTYVDRIAATTQPGAMTRTATAQRRRTTRRTA